MTPDKEANVGGLVWRVKAYACWLRHGATIVTLVAGGAVAWTNMARDVEAAEESAAAAHGKADANRSAIEELADRIGDIETAQGVVATEVKGLSKAIDREREVEAGQRKQMQGTLNRILDRIDTAGPHGR